MSISIVIPVPVTDTIALLFPYDEHGHICFGFAGRTIEPQSPGVLAKSPIRIRDYLMERFVAYSLRLIPADLGTMILIDNVSDGRDADVEWFSRKYIKSKGIDIAAGGAH